MFIDKWFRDKLTNPTSLPRAYAQDIETNRQTVNIPFKYSEMTELLADDRLYSIIVLTSAMVSDAYKGIAILPKSQYKDDELKDKEIDAVDKAVKFARTIDVERLFHDYTWNMILYGDYVERMIIGGEGVKELKSVPLNALTIVESEEQLTQKTAIVMEANLYIVNELFTTNRKEYKAEDVVHVSFHNRGQWRKDIANRDTYGIYSIPPLATLKKLKEWKYDTINKDMKWKSKLIPRTHWQVDTDDVVPAQFSGDTIEKKMENANNEIDKRLREVGRIVDTPEPDKSVITSKGIEGKILEVKGATYAKPNETLQQINSYLGTTVGIPDAYLGGKPEGYAGLSSVSVVNSLRSAVIAKNVARSLEKVIRRHLGIAYPQLSQ